MESSESLNFVPALSRETVRQLDRTAIECFGVPGLVLMENAARGVTDVLISKRFPASASKRSVMIFCGVGNNAGDGLAVARHLQLRRISCQILLCASPERFRGDALFQYELAQKLGLPMIPVYDSAGKEDVWARLDQTAEALGGSLDLVDALLGTGAGGAPRFPMDATVAWINHCGRRGNRILAIDVPSGLDCETGRPFAVDSAVDSAVRANVTVTLAAPKPGLMLSDALPFVGELIVSDIGISVEKLLKEMKSV